MLLHQISITGFRPFKNKIIVDLDRITLLIGNNDSGKSSILDILDMALSGNKQPDKEDYFSCKSEACDSIDVELIFIVEEFETEACQFAIDKLLTFRIKYQENEKIEEYKTLVPTNNRLNCEFNNLLADDQKEIIREFDPEALNTHTRKETRIEWYNEFIKTVEKVTGWKPIPSGFYKILPIIQRYSAMDYFSPENIINQTVKNIFESVLYIEDPKNLEQRVLRKSLTDLESEAEEKINFGIEELSTYIRRYAPYINQIRYEPQIDFMRGFQKGDFRIDEGQGEHYLTKSGDGTKRKIFMATTDWDRDINLRIQEEEGKLRSVIRAYDEPDTNLDYQAQHQLFNSIYDISSGNKSNIQSIVSTHSPRMIDRAPATGIRMIRSKDNITQIIKLETDSNEEVEKFLSQVARQLGLTNTLMFYEKCFLFVEGETEELSLPLFYKKIYERNLLEDGINIINLRGKSAFKEFLKLFSKNKQEISVFLMDKDCEKSKEDRLTIQVLRENGFSDHFCEERVILIGNAEFEDIFTNELYVKVFNKKWPKASDPWIINDFLEIDPNKKYSDELKRLVFTYSDEKGDKWSKPDLGYELGKMCEKSEIPEEIIDLLSILRKIAQIE